MNKWINGMKNNGVFKKMSISIVIFTLILGTAACGGAGNSNNDNATASFYYEESKVGDIIDGSAVQDIFRINSKGQAVIYGRTENQTAVYTLFDSESKPVGEINAGFPGEGGVYTLDSQDNLYAIERISSGSQTDNVLHVYNSAGESLKTIQLGKTDDQNGNGPSGYADIAVDSKGSIYLTQPNDKIRVLDKDGNELKIIDRGGCIRLAIGSNDSLFAATQSSNGEGQVEKIDASGNSVWKFALNMKEARYRDFIYNLSDNCLYLLRDDGVEKVDADGKPAGMVVTFSDFEIKNTGFAISGIGRDKDNNLLILTASVMGGPSKGGGPKGDKIQYQLFRYTRKEGANPDSNKTEITVLARRPGDYLQAAAGIFNQANPGYKIKIITVPEGESRDQFITQINTEIMAGKGPDIMMTDWWIPYEKYISKGIFVDIAQLMAQDKSFDPSLYNAAIIDGMKRNGQLPMLPVSFSFNAMMANKTILDEVGVTIDDNAWSWDDFKAVAEKVVLKDSQGNPTRTALPNVGPSDLIDYFLIFGNQVDQFVDRETKKASFDSKEFQDMLELVKSFSNNNLTSSGMKQGMMDVIDATVRGAVVFKPDAIQDYLSLTASKATFGGNEAVALNFPHEAGNDAGVYGCPQMFAINKASKYQDKAWEFLKILLFKDIQMQDINGFPVNNEARAAVAQQAVQDSASGENKIGIGDKSLKAEPLTQADVDRMNEMIGKLERVSLIDDQILGIIHEEMNAFFSGDKTAADVANLIQNRVNTYLNE